MVCPAAGVVGARGLACKVTGAGAIDAMVTGRLPVLKVKISNELLTHNKHQKNCFPFKSALGQT